MFSLGQIIKTHNIYTAHNIHTTLSRLIKSHFENVCFGSYVNYVVPTAWAPETAFWSAHKFSMPSLFFCTPNISFLLTTIIIIINHFENVMFWHLCQLCCPCNKGTQNCIICQHINFICPLCLHTQHIIPGNNNNKFLN